MNEMRQKLAEMEEEKMRSNFSGGGKQTNNQKLSLINKALFRRDTSELVLSPEKAIINLTRKSAKSVKNFIGKESLRNFGEVKHFLY